MTEQLIVIKLGGHAMDDAQLLQAFAQDVATLSRKGFKFVIVHGGGPHINSLLKRLNIQSEFVNGLRVTDVLTLEVVELALCGQVNKATVRNLLKAGVMAVGVSGEDAGMLEAVTKDSALGRVGKVTKVNTHLLRSLLDDGFVPVVAPLALDNGCEPLNVNADTAAGAIAGALQAKYFVLLSDVPGVLDGEKMLMEHLSPSEIASMRQSGVINGGMIPKVECCQTALETGCGNAIILDGRPAHSLQRFIENGEALGTIITA